MLSNFILYYKKLHIEYFTKHRLGRSFKLKSEKSILTDTSINQFKLLNMIIRKNNINSNKLINKYVKIQNMKNKLCIYIKIDNHMIIVLSIINNPFKILKSNIMINSNITTPSDDQKYSYVFIKYINEHIINKKLYINELIQKRINIIIENLL